MLVTKLLNSIVTIPSNYEDYSYGFIIFYSSCDDYLAGEIINYGNFLASGENTVSAQITYEDECDIIVRFVVLVNDTVCQTNYFYINDDSFDSSIHWECRFISGDYVCLPVVGEYDEENPLHYSSDICNNECSSPPLDIFWDCSNNCSEGLQEGDYLTQQLCLNNCFSITEPCENGLYGYSCNNGIGEYEMGNLSCTNIMYGGEYSTISQCQDGCDPPVVTSIFNYDCDDEIFFYYIESPALSVYDFEGNLFSTDQIAFTINGIVSVLILFDRIVINGVTTYQDNTLGNVIISGEISTPPFDYNGPPYSPSPLAVIIYTIALVDLDVYYTGHGTVPINCTTEEDLAATLNFNCEVDSESPVYMLDITASGGFPAYHYHVEYIVDGISYYQYTTQSNMGWTGSEMSLNLGIVVPETIILTVVDYYNNCITIQHTPDCKYLCNNDYEVDEESAFRLDILVDFSGSSTNNSFPQMAVDTNGYTEVWNLHIDTVRKVIEHYEDNLGLMGLNKLKLRVILYDGSYEWNCGTNTYTCVGAVDLLNGIANYNDSALYYVYNPSGLLAVKTMINNTIWCYTDNNNYFQSVGGDTIMCAVEYVAQTAISDNHLIVVLTDYLTGGPSDGCEASNNCLGLCNGGAGCSNQDWHSWNPLTDPGILSNNKIHTIHSGYYPEHVLSHPVTLNATNYGFDIILSNYWDKFDTNRVHILNKSPEEIRDYILFLVDYYRSGFDLPCITIEGDGFDSCPTNCNVSGYDCFDGCEELVEGGIYISQEQCLQFCPPAIVCNLSINANYNCDSHIISYNISNGNGPYSIDFGICGDVNSLLGNGTLVCNLNDEDFIVINVEDDNGCTAQTSLVIDCNTSFCDLNITTIVVGQGSSALNDCGRIVPPLTDNYHCAGADCLPTHSIYSGGLYGYYDYKYSKLVQGINNCPEQIVAFYTYSLSTHYNIYPKSSILYDENSSAIYSDGNYEITPNEIIPSTGFNLLKSGNLLPTNVSIIDDWTTSNSMSFASNFAEITIAVEEVFTIWSEFISNAFGINFIFSPIGNLTYDIGGVYASFYQLEDPNTTPNINNQIKADFFLSMVQDNRVNTMFDFNDKSLGVPLNYQNVALSKGGVIVFNHNLTTEYTIDTFKAQLFKTIGHSLGLRNPYVESINFFNNCISNPETSNINSTFTLLNTFMAADLENAILDDYIVDGLLNDAICTECLQKRYLTV